MADPENKPTPDPTVLTTEQLLREAEWVNKLVDSKLGGIESVFDEKFSSVKEQFALVERQRVEQKKDTKDAVDAAFSAAKEAVKEQTAASDKSISKSETATTEQLKQLAQTITAAQKGTDDAISELKARVGKIEDVKQGAVEFRTEARAQISNTGVVVGVVAALLGSLALYLGIHSTRTSPVVVTPTVTVPTK